MNSSTEQPLFLVSGRSMAPVLRTGDRVELRPVERQQLHRGDILVFPAASGRTVIHRVVRLVPLQTRGDNCRKDDLPVPPDVPLFQALSFWRHGRRRRLSSGRSGMLEFHKNQLRRMLIAGMRKMLDPIAVRNPFRIPFARLTRTVFSDRTVYYAGKYPVGWSDEKGWHWMRFARCFVEAPPKDVRSAQKR